MTSQNTPRAIGAREADKVFEKVGTSIFALMKELGEVKDQTVFVASLVGADEQKDLIAKNDAIGSFLAEVARDVEFLASQMGSLDANAKELRLLLKTQESDLRLAAMVATNARVVSSTLSDKDGSLAQFAEDAQSLMAEAVERISALQKSLMTADDQLHQSEQTIRRFSAEVQTLLAHGAKLPELITTLPTQQMDQAAIQAGRSLANVERSLDAATAHLQAGDAVRQRLEHVTAISDDASRAKGVVKQALDCLASAQQTEAINALSAAAGCIQPELHRMSETWGRLASELDGLTDDGTRKKLQALERVLSGIVDGSKALFDLRNQIREGLTQLVTQYAKVIPHLHSAVELDREMSLLSINTILASGRLGENGKALMEVSRQLRETTGQTGRQGKRIAELSQAQEDVITAINAQDLDMHDQTYQTSLSSILDKVTRLSETLDQIDRAASGWASQSPFDGIGQQLSRIMGFRLLDANSAIRLQAMMAQDRAVVTALADAERRYTMPAERELHDELTGRAPKQTVADTPQDLGIFFD